MAEADHSQNISEFCNLTGADPDRARFYLEAAGWDTNLAMSSYYEEADEAHDEEVTAVFPPPTASPKPKTVPASGPRIATFANLANDNEEEEEEGQAFYAGGSVRSGQQVLGPGKRKSGNQIVEDLFDAVKKNCGELLSQSDKKPSSSTKIKAFHGAGYVLGSTPQEGEIENAAGNNSFSRPPTEIRLSLWKTGFTVDNGPLRDYEEPQNKEFLNSIRQGEVPMELRRQANGAETHLSLDDHSHEEYAPPKKTLQAFSGAGFRLGNISPKVASASTIDCKENEERANSSIGLDDSKPTTSVQIRLADGSRLVMNANYNHTVGDIRRFIVLSRPEYSGSEFSLMTSFPTKELNDDSASLEESSLLNSVIVQKLK